MTRRLAMGVALAALAGGCGGIDNARVDVGGDVPLALEDQADRRDDALVESDARSVTGVSREDWAPLTIVLAPDGTQHWPRLTKGGPRYLDHHPRLTGAHPTPASALEIESSLDGAPGEFFAAPVHGGWDVIMAIPRAIMGLQHDFVVASPAYAYQRAAPLDNAPVSPAPDVAPIEDPETVTPEDAGE